MTEQEWSACVDPDLMLKILPGQVSGRKARLFACACCRRIAHLLPDPCLLKAIDCAERYTDGLVAEEEWLDMNCAVVNYRGLVEHNPTRAEEAIASGAVLYTLVPFGRTGFWHHIRWAGYQARRAATRAFSRLNAGTEPRSEVLEDLAREAGAQAGILREVIGPLLFLPLAIDPVWQTRSVRALAQTIYDDQHFQDLPILGDALEDAGCSEAALLEHCRVSATHVRGCWVVDLLLGKS
jgi:hypothetical protein